MLSLTNILDEKDKIILDLTVHTTHHVQKKGEGKKEYPEVEVEAVGEGALMGVDIPASGQRSPHPLAQNL